jgi:mannan endo-1,4-beta-mannosidase
MAIELWNAGGIPTYSWHWRDPLKNSNGFYKTADDKEPDAETDFVISLACTDNTCASWNTNSDAYKGIIADIDTIAQYLTQLQDAGVAIVWRPLHEASGGWFWWGADGAKPLVALYKLLYDRLTNHHNLHNLIWVWNSEGGSDAAWYPGDNFVDIIGRDYYYHGTTPVDASLIGEFEAIKKSFGLGKMIALSENGIVPSAEKMEADGASWSYFMSWVDHITSENTAAHWNEVMNSDFVITLDEMPGWDTYKPTPVVSGPENPLIKNIKVQTFDIRGNRVHGTPQTPGVYIVRQGSQTKSIVVRP